jgi:hypothetical protein
MPGDREGNGGPSQLVYGSEFIVVKRHQGAVSYELPVRISGCPHIGGERSAKLPTASVLLPEPVAA